MRANGHGVLSIARALDADGIAARRGGEEWSVNSIRNILRRDAYIGHSVVGKNSRGTYERITPEPVTIKNTHPPIIDQESWEAVQRVAAPTRDGKRRVRGSAPLSGLLKCGRCGKSMYAVTFGKGSYYVCSTHHYKGKCGCCAVRREPILQAVASKIRQHVLMGSQDRLEAAIQRQLDKRQPQLKSDRKESARKLADLERQLARAGDRMLTVDDSLVPELEKRMLVLKRQRDELAKSIEAAPTPEAPPSAKALASRIWELDRILAKAAPAVVREALRQLIAEIRLDFRPAGVNKRGRRFEFTGGVMLLLPEAYQHPLSAI
jgi:hypothetical protein